ncbi:MAG: cytochrome c biogenesis protein CcsA [Candidatus Hydrogenedentes bacterium]|nr:cytochrome c biogenesis protein CcsA [Candidatus Hydrogenedentota bacterium]
MIPRFLATFVIGATVLASALAEPIVPTPTPRWDAEALRMFATLPVQDGGRIKPLDTYANFTLLKFNGKRKCELPDGTKITPLEWLLDCVFFPEQAQEFRVFRVDSPEVLDALAVPHTAKRDRYSYRQLLPGRGKLFSLAGQYAGIDPKERTPVQTQLVNLAQNVHEFESLTRFMHFAAHPIAVGAGKKLQEIFAGAEEVRYSDIIAKASAIRDAFMAIRGPHGAGENSGELNAVSQLIHDAETAGAPSDALALFPPSGKTSDTEWLTPAELLQAAFMGTATLSDQVELLRRLEEIAAHPGQTTEVRTAIAVFHDKVTALATARGDYGKIPLEVALYNSRVFNYSLFLFLLSFVLSAFLWLKLRSRLLYAMTSLAVLLPTLLLVVGITVRCIIRSRPPVTTLYETILFITAVAVVVALFIEYVNRQRVALSLAAILGSLGLFLGNKYEALEGTDTMPSMIAVLDTNFWLSTHVTSITVGYAAGMLAGAIGHVYILGRLFKFRRDDTAFYKTITRMVYGVLCFGLLFAVVGTVLGGIWANDSWGRFWGWDPKENGALMIVLWGLTVIHARLGGYIRDFGISMAAIVGAMIVAFSWFGVNLLGVGLHSYGFTSGIFRALLVFYVVEVVVLLVGAGVWFRDTRLQGKPVVAPAAAKLPSRKAKPGWTEEWATSKK